MKRTGIEPVSSAWKADVLPLYQRSVGTTARTGNRTRGPTMATLDFTTKPFLQLSQSGCLLEFENI